MSLNLSMEKSRRVEILIVCQLLALALAVRLWHFGAYPAGINQDEAMSAVDARAIAEYGTDRYGNPHPVFFEGWKIGQQSAFSIYLMSFFFKFLPFNEVSTRLPQLLLSLVGMLAACWTVSMLFGKRAALFALGLLAIDPWHIMQSRWMLDCNSLPHVFICGFALLIHGLRKKRFRELYAAFLIFGLAMYTYGVALFAVCFFLLLALLLLLIRGHFSFGRVVSFGLTWLLTAAPLLTMTVINQFELPSIRNRFFSIQYFPESVRVNDILFFSQNFWGQLLINFRSLVNTLVLQTDSELYQALPWIGAHYLIYPLFCVLGCWMLVKMRKSAQSDSGLCLELLGCFLLTGLATGLVVSHVNISRINIIHYALLSLTALGLDSLWQQRRKAASVSIALYALCFGWFGWCYFRTEKHAINDLYFNGYKEAIRYADSFPGQICIANSMFEHNYSMVTEILTQYYLPIDAPYYQGLTNEYVSSTGKAMNLSYSERFHYVDYLQDQLEAYTGCTMVSFYQFADSYREAGYTIHEFPNYIVAVK